MHRKEKVLKAINLKKGCGLEIGPLFSPVVSKDEASIYYLDHMSQEDLKIKYKGHPIPLENIVPVDYVLNETDLKGALKGKKFDYVIASHVIEHIPDLIRWLQDISSVLKPGGILSLVVPDKRYCFDINREVSKPSDVMGAYYDRLSKASSAMIYDSASEFCADVTPMKAWSKKIAVQQEPSDYYLDQACQRCVANLHPKEYVDSHCYVFTPESFFNILRRLMRHSLLDFEIAYFCDTSPNELEFYVSLRKIRLNSASKKRQLTSLSKFAGSIQSSGLEQQVRVLTAQIAEITNSKSWKITEPLRAINSFLNNCKHKLLK